MTHMQSDQFWTSIDLLGLPIGPIQAYSSIYAVGHFLKTKSTLGRTDGPSPSRENLYTQIINIILSCINATKTCNTAIERQLCELFKSVRFLKLTLLLKYTGRFK